MSTVQRGTSGGRTAVHGEPAEERLDILDGLLGRDLVEVFGEGVRNEDAVEGCAAAGVEVYFLEGAEAVVVEGEIDGEVDVGAGLRENFDPRRRWRTAIRSVRAIGRLGSGLGKPKDEEAKSGTGWGSDSDTDIGEVVQDSVAEVKAQRSAKQMVTSRIVGWSLKACLPATRSATRSGGRKRCRTCCEI